MFERLLIDALTKKFGHLVDNLDPDKVRISTWNGKLVLEDLVLRPDALDSLVEQCPVQMEFGKIGRLEAQVPWSLVGAELWNRKTKKDKQQQQQQQQQQSTQGEQEEGDSNKNGNLRVLLSDVYILITPRQNHSKQQQQSRGSDHTGNLENDGMDNEENGDDILQRRKARERKEKAAQELLDAQILSRVAGSSHTGSSRWQWAQELISRLISYLSITVQNIHIRYEDPGHCMGFVWSSVSSGPNHKRKLRHYRESFAVGITLKEFSVKSASKEKENPQQNDITEKGSLVKKASDEVDLEIDPSSLARPSSPDSAISKDLSEQADESEQQSFTRAYRIQRKRVVAHNLAIYWDSNGCSLICTQNNANGSQTQGELLLNRAYIESTLAKLALAKLNKSEPGIVLPDDEYSREQHSYLLYPVSPSLDFALVTNESQLKAREDDDGGNSCPNISASSMIPPSSVHITLPPTSFSISRQVLEDTVYIRKSLDVWMHSKKGIISNASLKRLANLRPTKSATVDPQGWWKYAIEATMAFIQVGRALEATDGTSMQKASLADGSVTRTTKVRGWLGLARALGKRRRYVALYRELFAGIEDNQDTVYGPILPQQELQLRTHNSLVELESDLTAPEIAAFRVSAYFALTGSATTDTSSTGWKNIETIINKAISESTADAKSASFVERLSLGHRCNMFLEMGQALEREKANKAIREEEEDGLFEPQDNGRVSADSLVADSGASLWEIVVSCKELSLQVNDRRLVASQRGRDSQRSSSVPVVRLSCACLSENTLFHDGSWEVVCTIAELQAEDLTYENPESMPVSMTSRWRTLIGRKCEGAAGELLKVDGDSFEQSLRLSVRRTFLSALPNTDPESGSPELGSITKTQIRLFPLEMVYSTVPFEALSRVLATVKTPELAEDYHRMASRIYDWRQKQKKRLLQALAHKRKTIVVDVDVTAPVLLIPEALDRDDSPLLVLDLGHLHFSNVPKNREVISTDFDDAWWLSLNNVQMQCSTTMVRREPENSDIGSSGQSQLQGPQQVVEKFSLDCSILTQIGEEGDEIRVKVAATLPRLSFNLTSSSVRLVNRLRYMWAKRKDEIQQAGVPELRRRPSVESLAPEENHAKNNGENIVSTSEPSRTIKARKVEHVFEFLFSAPIITIGLENDVDGRCLSNTDACTPLISPSTSIISLAIQGIGGNLLKKVSKSGSMSTDFDARLQSLVAVDHYQTAGSDFALLLSSVDPTTILNSRDPESWKDVLQSKSLLLPSTGNDLVLVKFSSLDDPKRDDVGEAADDSLSINFHELYVEWNPETIAAIQKAMRMPPNTVISDTHISFGFGIDDEDSDEFFDAEMTPSDDTFFDSLANPDRIDLVLNSPLGKLTRESTKALLHGTLLSFDDDSSTSLKSVESDETSRKKASSSPDKLFEVVFNLSRLRVNFNKEARHRRLFTAEMDQTYIQYLTRRPGGSKTTARLGNLVFSDPSSTDYCTIYHQILGLQKGTNLPAPGSVSSLLEMEIVSNPRTRGIAAKSSLQGMQELEAPVSLCYEDDRVFGADTFIDAKFSPMQFVYLQQLWSEIVDYFFEGIMGYEVLGKVRPIVAVPTLSGKNEVLLDDDDDDDDSDPSKVSFTKFSFSIESPIVVFPVTYRSPQFLKLSVADIRVSNEFNCNTDKSRFDVARWHNNCTISLQSLQLISWDGKAISQSNQSRNSAPQSAAIKIRWPIGPLATTERPKWDVQCELDSVNFVLRKSDYALLQNIISYNVGEESRHLDEWNALQNLSDQELEAHKASAMVHFGYDKKDIAPTTYQIRLGIPLVQVTLEAETTVGIIRCSNFSWGMRKLADRVSCQTVTCDIDLVHPNGDQTETLLSFNQSTGRKERDKVMLPELTYSSTSKPCGDNVKTLHIVNSCIYLVYPAWKAMLSFFSGLPEVEVMSAEEVSNSIQIGERWYRITASPHGGDQGAREATIKGKSFSWIDSRTIRARSDSKTFLHQPSFQLRITLSSPCIILSTKNTGSGFDSVVLRLRHLDLLHTKNGTTGVTNKSFLLHDLEVYTSSHGEVERARNVDPTTRGLIHPWCVSGVMQSCANELECDCKSHSIRLAADVLKARAAFSDMMIAVEVCLRFVADFRQSKIEVDDEKRILPGLPGGTADGLNEATGPTSDIGVSSPQLPATPKKYVVTMDWSGFEFLVVDDSGRHFAGSQELFTLVLGNILFSRKTNKIVQDLTSPKTCDLAHDKFTHEMTLQLQSIDLLDCLQPVGSKFRHLFSSQAALKTEDTKSRTDMDWKTFAMQESETWGFSVAPALRERIDNTFSAIVSGSTHTMKEPAGAVSFTSSDSGGDTRSYKLKVRPCSIQYNPSTVIALQRFLGRFKKATVQSLEVFNDEIDKYIKASEAAAAEEVASSRYKSIESDVELESLSISLNKEHQQRRLVRIDLSGCQTTLSSNKTGIAVEGCVGDLSIWDCDEFTQQRPETSWQSPNACVLKVLRDKNIHAKAEGDASNSFLDFRFSTFSKGESTGIPTKCNIPLWVRSHIERAGMTGHPIDDCLEVSLSTIELTYLRERTQEVLDYLSNGLPGKGMGATSKAAQGFLQKRIQTKSFLQLRIDSPTLYLPEDEMSTSGLRIRLGDVQLNSWYEGGGLLFCQSFHDMNLENSDVPMPSLDNLPEEQKEWWRMLSLKVVNFSASVFKKDGDLSSYDHLLNQGTDLFLVLQKSTWHSTSMSLKSRVSLVNIALKYSSYCQIYAVLQGNLGKKIDKAKWDNIEKAYDLEIQQIEGEVSEPIEYAPDARHVRYGKKVHKKEATGSRGNTAAKLMGDHNNREKETLIDVHLTFDGFALKLRRDDSLQNVADDDKAFEYDMVYLRVELVKVSITNETSEDLSFRLSLYRIGFFDLGDSGRRLRESLAIQAQKGEGKKKLQEARRPCAFVVLVEGYTRLDDDDFLLDDIGIDMQNDPQLVVTIDRIPSSSIRRIGSHESMLQEKPEIEKAIAVEIVLNLLSVNAILRPFREVAAFFARTWPLAEQAKAEAGKIPGNADLQNDTIGIETASDEIKAETVTKNMPSSASCVQLKLVAHHPRIFFVSDETDPHSRGLVLKGLAVVNVGQTTKTIIEAELSGSPEYEDIQTSLVVDAQLHSLETFINPDVHTALSLQQWHVDILKTEIDSSLFVIASADESDQLQAKQGALGVALLQPVTTGIEFGKCSRSRFPSRRFACIDVEPISIALSFDDLQLIESILKRLTTKTEKEDMGVSLKPGMSNSDQPMSTRPIDDSQSARPYDVVFHSDQLGLGLRKQNNSIVVDAVSDGEEEIQVGDILDSIQGKKIANPSLSDIVHQFTSVSRPTTVTFLRPTHEPNDTLPTIAIVTPKKLGESEESSTRNPIRVSYSLIFHRGMPNGLSLERSVIADIPVVTNVDPCIELALKSDKSSPRFPKPGAMITRITGISTAEIGFVDGFEAMQKLCDSCESPEDESGADQSSYEITFVERESWGNHDSLDLMMQDCHLTFIDDLNGRDMPLFRGNLETVEMHLRRGMGISTNVLARMKMPFLLHDTMSCGTENSVSLSAGAKTTVEYFHPRKSVYEPCLEPSQLCLLYERHNTSSKEVPDEVAIEIADRMLDAAKPTAQKDQNGEPQIVCVNFSDAACEVFARTLLEWKKWRKVVKRNTDILLLPELLDDDSIGARSPQTHTLPEDLVSFDHQQGHSIPTKAVAASDAAQKALVFAQKRGAEKSAKSESSKPFIFQNRTGISVAFAQQERTKESQRTHQLKKSESKISLVGEYTGLEDYLLADVTELADGEDAEFQMEYNQETSTDTQETSKRLRTYEGHFHRLLVAIQAVAGVLVEPLTDLQVQKAGTSIRHLTVRQSEENLAGKTENSQFQLAVCWKVQVLDNRRVLTLSSAVRVVSLSSTFGIEIGIRKSTAGNPSIANYPAPCEVDVVLQEEPIDALKSHTLGMNGIESTLKGTILDNSIELEADTILNSAGASRKSPVQTIGVSLPESPVYLPLWLAINREPVEIYVRPKLKGASSDYDWSTQSVLSFAPSIVIDTESERQWSWQDTFPGDLGSIRCSARDDGAPATFLSCYSTDLAFESQERIEDDAQMESLLQRPKELVIDAGLSIKNVMPINVYWQASHAAVDLCNGEIHSTEENLLRTGECVDIIKTNFKVESLLTRFCLEQGGPWSDWALVSSFKEDVSDNNGGLGSVGASSPLQTSVQVIDEDFGSPTTLGIRIIKKMSTKEGGTGSKAICFGVDVILYAELWISNLTTLPLTFGCPVTQIHKANKSTHDDDESSKISSADQPGEASVHSAEAALMEIASVLELGEKGSKMDTRKATLQEETGAVVILPQQESSSLVEEVFEFVEIGDSGVKRRWWASENYWSLRDSSILELSDYGKPWYWVDETWKIDCTGQASTANGGWESCKDLLGSDGPFSLHRQFDPTHPFRRRRWFRTRSSVPRDKSIAPTASLLPGLQGFHHPLTSPSLFQDPKKEKEKKKRQRQRNNFQEDHPRQIEADQTDTFNISIKCGDSRWSTPATCSSHGGQHGVVQVFASRWPYLVGTNNTRTAIHTNSGMSSTAVTSGLPIQQSYGTAPLKPDLYDLVYHIKEVEGEYGEFSRLMLVSARYSVRNDSESKTIEVKQSGTKDDSAIRLAPGKISPFHFSDFRLPQLVCVRPVHLSGGNMAYKWSGGFDLRTLGMTALSIRPFSEICSSIDPKELVRSMRALVELRPGTGGLAINVSFKEERLNGEGALFRIENRSSFNIWFAQEGILQNPSLSTPHPTELDGDLISPGEKISFGLDVPFRQGKYAHRKAASMSELLHVRVALAPLSTTAGIETVKCLGLSDIGEQVRLKPSKLASMVGTAQAAALERVRVLAIIAADGPSRVLKFCSMANPEVDTMLGNAFMDSVAYGNPPTSSRALQEAYTHGILEATSRTQHLLDAGKLPTESEARRDALFGEETPGEEPQLPLSAVATEHDRQISCRVSFTGFLISLIDSAPSEICTITVNNINALAKWCQSQTSDATLLVSIGWLQVDNHCPNAPYPVAIIPDNELQDSKNAVLSPREPTTPAESSETGASPPLLFAGIEFAPKHSSGIVCLKSATIALQDIAVSLDLAFLVRLQKFASEAKAHFYQQRATTEEGALYNYRNANLQEKRVTNLPNIPKLIAVEDAATAAGVGAIQVYIGTLAVLPFNITLSVNPAQALTPAQAAFEGIEAAAIHKAVRKGDLSLGRNTHPLGVIIGRRNKTAAAVAQGVLKSFVVDALLRMKGASLNLNGAFLRNGIFTQPQFVTYLGAHYLYSLRQNMPALLGSLAAFGNPLGLLRGIGDGVTDFVTEPVKGLKKSLQELDPSHVVDGVARGTGSLAKHTVGGFADSAALLTSTFSKNLAVLTLDRRYAQKRDRSDTTRDQVGVESAFVHLAQGFIEGVTGVVRAPVRGAEKRGVEGFFKGLGKGLLGLLVKPMIGISDAATDVFVGVKSSVEGEGHKKIDRRHIQVRPRRALYGRDKQIRNYDVADAAACALMLRTRIGGQHFISHLDMDDRVALLSDKRLLLLDSEGKDLLLVKFKHIANIKVSEYEAGSWSIVIMLNHPRTNGSVLEVITCKDKSQAIELCEQIKHGMSLVETDS